VQDAKAIGFRRISIYDLDGRPSPLPHADAWRAGELDLPVRAFDCNARSGFGNALPVRAVGTPPISDSDPATDQSRQCHRLGQPTCALYLIAFLYSPSFGGG
jgi:hypothetical protein